MQIALFGRGDSKVWDEPYPGIRWIAVDDFRRMASEAVHHRLAMRLQTRLPQPRTNPCGEWLYDRFQWNYHFLLSGFQCQSLPELRNHEWISWDDHLISPVLRSRWLPVPLCPAINNKTRISGRIQVIIGGSHAILSGRSEVTPLWRSRIWDCLNQDMIDLPWLNAVWPHHYQRRNYQFWFCMNHHRLRVWTPLSWARHRLQSTPDALFWSIRCDGISVSIWIQERMKCYQSMLICRSNLPFLHIALTFLKLIAIKSSINRPEKKSLIMTRRKTWSILRR